MGKGIVLVGAVVVAAGGAAAYVYVADSPLARSTRASIAKWGLGGSTAAETAKTERESRFRRSEPVKPVKRDTGPATVPAGGTAENVGVKPTPATTPATAPPTQGEDWGALDSDAAKAEKQRKADAALASAIEAARKGYRRLQLDAAIGLREAMTDGAGTDLRAEAATLLARMDLADRLTAGIEQNELADHTGVVEVTLVSGKTRQGRLVEETSGDVTIQGDFGIRAKFSRDQIKHVTRLTPAERKARLEAEVTAKRSQRADADALAIFKLAEWCVENGLPGKAVDFIEEAAAQDPTLVATVRDDRAARLFRHYIWLRLKQDRRAPVYAERITKQFGDTKYAGELATLLEEAKEELKQFRRPSLPEAQPETPAAGGDPDTGTDPDVEQPRPVRRPPSGNVSNDEKDGDDFLRKAEGFAEGAQPSKPDSAQNAKRAIEMYKQAMAAYEKAFNAASEGDRLRLEEKLAETGEGLYWTKKMARLW